MNTQTHNLQHTLLPIYIIKKSADGNIIGRKRIHFQISAGNTYKISYKFFIPRGFHLAPDITPSVNCQLIDGALNVPKVTFVYIQNTPIAQSQNGSVTVKFLDANTGRQIGQQDVTGYSGQHLNVLQHVAIPSGYHLLDNQKTDLTIQSRSQILNLLVRRGQSAPRPARVQTGTFQTSQNDGYSTNDDRYADDEQMILHSIQAYNQQLHHTLLHLIMKHNLKLLKKVTVALAHNAGYQNTAAVKADLKHHKVVGLADNGSDAHDGIYFRARHYQHNRPVLVSEVRDFITCVVDSHAASGWFITTSTFTATAQHEAHRHHIRMINGHQLAHLMIQNGIGTRIRSVYKIADVDPSFFE